MATGYVWHELHTWRDTSQEVADMVPPVLNVGDSWTLTSSSRARRELR